MEAVMGIKQDIILLNCSELVGFKYYIEDYYLSQTSRNIISTLFEPYKVTQFGGCYKLSRREVKIVIDILELMED
jgi:hypothetical protein